MDILHVLTNAIYVFCGIVGGSIVAWLIGVERRYSIRPEFLILNFLLTALASLLITAKSDDSMHVWLGLLVGFLVGLGTAFWSRLRARAKPRAGKQPTIGRQ